MAHTGPWEVKGTGGRLFVTTEKGVAVAGVHGYPRRPHANLLAAAPDMLDALLLVAENEECVCVCAKCSFNTDYHNAETLKALGVAGHDYTPPALCLGCQVDAAIKLAEKGE